MGVKYLDTKAKSRKMVRKGELITSHADLKNFTKQVESKHIPDEHFKKAYDTFKRPPYQLKGE